MDKCGSERECGLFFLHIAPVLVDQDEVGDAATRDSL